MFRRVLESVLLSHARKVSGKLARKAVALGVARMLVLPEVCQKYAEFWYAV